MGDITSLPFEELIEIGLRLQTQYLLPQADYTLGLANEEGTPLAAILPPRFLEKLTAARDSVAKALGNRVVQAAEAKQSTSLQNVQLRAVKVWGRKACARARSAIRMGVSVPVEMSYTIGARSVAGALDQARKLAALLVQHSASLDTVCSPTQPLVDEGNAAIAALEKADRDQELTRMSALPSVLADFYAKKAELYLGLKVVNDAGHELHAHNPRSSSRFNLSLLHRRHRSEPTEPETTPAPLPAQPAPSPTTTP